MSTPAGPIPGAQALTQFGQFLSACGEAASVAIAHVVNGTPANVGMVNALVQDLQHFGRADPNGASTLNDEIFGLQQLGVSAQQTSLADAFAAARSGTPVELEVSQGGNLPGHTDTSLQYHFISILGADSTGFDVADSDTAAGQAGDLIHESQAQINAASPYAAAVVTGGSGVGPGIGTALGSAQSAAQNAANASSGVLQWPAQVVGAFGSAGTLLDKLLSANWSDIGMRALLIGVGAMLVLISAGLFAASTARHDAQEIAPVLMAAAK